MSYDGSFRPSDDEKYLTKVAQKPDLSKLTDFAEQVRLAGLRPTLKRVATAALLFDGRRHVSAETFTEDITATSLQVCLGTIYNTLIQFTDAGLLSPVMMHNQ